jgi:hypothetical protein
VEGKEWADLGMSLNSPGDDLDREIDAMRNMAFRSHLGSNPSITAPALVAPSRVSISKDTAQARERTGVGQARGLGRRRS